ncbi:unnamed protein product [Lactuca virosa]|uniref:Uncharacterized protein n=1 Tax=Lactuca virosa TaxID=75947 RepID=A0AAU9MIN9_9ASTR|nr:unnamed protein product [Lactuca virosa]
MVCLYFVCQGDDNTVAQSPFLKEDVMALKDLDGLIPEPVVMAAAPVQKPAGEKKMEGAITKRDIVHLVSVNLFGCEPAMSSCTTLFS